MLSHSKHQQTLTFGIIAGLVLFLASPAISFAVEPDPTPTPTPTDIIPPAVVIPPQPFYTVTTLDERQMFILSAPLLIIMILMLAGFMTKYATPIRLKFFR